MSFFPNPIPRPMIQDQPAHSHQKEFWESVKKRREPSHPAVRAFALPKIRKIAELLPPGQNPSLLEVGCGNGYFTYYLKDFWRVLGIDRSRRMLDLNPFTRTVQGDVDHLPLASGSFDIVFSTNLLHHLQSPETALREMARVTRKYLVLVEPNRNNPLMFLFSLIKQEERMALRFSLSYLSRLAQKAGLNLLSSSSHGSITPNLTPAGLVPLLDTINRDGPMGFYNLVIAEKPASNGN